FVSPTRGQQILDNLTLVRAQQVRAVIDNDIIPLVEQQALYGIAQTTIAMIPSDVKLPAKENEKTEFSFDTGSDKKVEVIGFSSEEPPQIVRLHGQMNRTEFWRLQAVVTELERRLKENLNASPTLRPPTPPKPEPAERRSSKNLLGRLTGAMQRSQERSPSGNPEVGVRQDDTAGRVMVKARLEEICLRTVNEFGLYDTMSKQCVIIQIDAR
ncbi:hypothetical protein BDV96DRAFT_460244, partial [Lophiotrema nucula]